MTSILDLIWDPENNDNEETPSVTPPEIIVNCGLGPFCGIVRICMVRSHCGP